MARKLKTYVTSIGFYDLAVAAPSMKAALEAWGSKANLFHQGFAQETDDPAIVAATITKPGVVLRRAVGTKDAFGEDAALPKSLVGKKPPPNPKKALRKKKAQGSGSARTADVVDLDKERASRRAAAAYEQERNRQEHARRKEEAQREKKARQRRHAVTAAEATLSAARDGHDARMKKIDDARTALERRADVEARRWETQKGKLEQALKRAKE